MEEAVKHRAAVLRRAYPRALARALAFTRSLPDAEDAMQEAVVRALSSWPQTGIPNSPEAWLLTVAKNAHRDRLRKGKWEAPQDALETLAQMSPWVQMAMSELGVAQGWKDELLQLLFACCHPALEPGESAALCLSTIVGFSTKEVAAAFVAAPRTMEQRLTRARRRLRERGDSDGAAPERSRDRLDAVLRVIHLLFNEGYWSNDDDAPIRAELCRLAIGLAHSLLEVFLDEPEVAGLLALLLLHDARRAARLLSDGTPVPLPEQDRSRWDRAAIERAERVLAAAAARGRPGPLQIEAAISAVHCRAQTSAETDWVEIAALYEQLEMVRPTPAVRVNRAFAVAQAQGPLAGLSLLEQDPSVASYPYVHLVKATLLVEIGEREQAHAHLLEAHRHARNAAERGQIEARIAALSTGGRS
jgi:RNA polymerase sigma-70 factor (ECF subfamily)